MKPLLFALYFVAGSVVLVAMTGLFAAVFEAHARFQQWDNAEEWANALKGLFLVVVFAASWSWIAYKIGKMVVNALPGAIP